MSIALTQAEQAILQGLRNSGKTQQRLARRAQIVLALAQGRSVSAIAQRLALTRPTVRKWRDRWRDAADRFVQAQREDEQPLEPLIVEVLSDARRSGKPADFTAEQITQIVALACESPEESGRPISQWTHRELAREAEKRGVVETISHRSVGRFLKRSRSQTASEPVLAQ